MFRRRRLAITLAALLTMAAGGILFALGLSQFGDSKSPPPARVFTARTAIPPTPTEVPAAPTPEPTPEPSSARIDRLIIKKIGVDAPIEALSLSPSGEMPDPKEGVSVGWYDFCSERTPVKWRGCPDNNFSQPGWGGNVVFAGHVYWLNKPSVFFGLSKMAEGDEIDVRLADGTLYAYRVVELQVYPPEGPHVEQIIGPAGREVVTLITCYGFNPSTRDYDNRVVIVAERMDASAAVSQPGR